MYFKKLFFITICFIATNCAGTPSKSPASYYETDEYFAKVERKYNYTPTQKRIIDVARSQIGTPYVYGGTSPNRGLDCSGFTQYVYKASVGVNLPRTARQQNRAGKYVARNYLLPGDLVFLDLSGDLSHVGIYIGDGRFFHASTSKNRLMVANMNSPYYAQRYDSAVRVARY